MLSFEFCDTPFLKNPMDGCFCINTFCAFSKMMANIISSWVFSWLDLKTGKKSEYSISNPYPEAYFQPIQTSVMELLGENSYQF